MIKKIIAPFSRMFLVVAIFLFHSVSCCAQQFKSDKYYYFFKTWNFVKYSHAQFALGELNADSVFLANLPLVDNATTSAEFDQFLSGFLEGFADPAERPEQIPETRPVLRKNFDHRWMHPGKMVSDKNGKRLESIYNKRYTGQSHFYLPALNYTSEIPNEPAYRLADSINPGRPLRLLALAKIQGAVDYLFPHKYLADVDLDNLIRKKIAAFADCDSRTQYELLLLELVAALNDTHSANFIREIRNKSAIFRNGFIPPFNYEVFQDGILITEIVIKDVCSAAGIKKGDFITHVNSVPVKKIVDTLSRLISVSNRTTLLYRLSTYSNNLVWRSEIPSFILKLQGDAKKHSIRFASANDPAYKTIVSWLTQKLKSPPSLSQPEIVGDSVACFRADHLSSLIDGIEDSLIDQTMNGILTTASSQRAIIFDMRRFIDWGGFIFTYVPAYFGTDSNHFADYFQLNPQEPGTYVLRTDPGTYYNADIRFRNVGYHGKVIILVGPGTLSQTEWNVMSLQKLFPQAITMGDQSAGADGDEKVLMLPGGYHMHFTGNAIFYPDGTEAQRRGVRIDKPFKRTKRSVLAEGDPLFEEALRMAGARELSNGALN